MTQRTTSSRGFELNLKLGDFTLSPSGATFHSTVQIPTWMEISLAIERPNAEPVKISGVVVEAPGSKKQGYRIACAFTAVDARTTELLSQLVMPASLA